jgi:hypothetical protein
MRELNVRRVPFGLSGAAGGKGRAQQQQGKEAFHSKMSTNSRDQTTGRQVGALVAGS